MKVYEDEKADRFGNYPALRIRGKDANPQKIYEELWGRYGGRRWRRITGMILNGKQIV